MSSRAESCPHCGRTLRRKRGIFHYTFWGTLSFIGTLCILAIALFVGSAVVCGVRDGIRDARNPQRIQARAAVPTDINLSPQQQAEVDGGYVLSPDDIHAIRRGRTAGFNPPTVTRNLLQPDKQP